jgi:hypothetical protein
VKILFPSSLVAIVLAWTAGIVAWQRFQDRQLQDERGQILAAQAQAARLAEQVGNPDKLRAQAAEADQLKAANKDLPSLRNQVRPLREANAEVEKLRASTQRLALQLQSPILVPKRLTEMEGFVAKEDWVPGGFNTPEAAVQSFFWAMREGDLGALETCLVPSERESLARQAANPAGLRKVMDEMRVRAARMKGFRIEGRTEEGDAKVVLSLQVAAGGDLMKIPLERIGREWKIQFFR